MTPEQEANYREFMRLLYEADALTPEQRAAYEQNTAASEAPAEAPANPWGDRYRDYQGSPFVFVGREGAGAIRPESDVQAYVDQGGDISDLAAFDAWQNPAPPSQPLPATPPASALDQTQRNHLEQSLRNQLALNNPNDFMDWQTPLLEQGNTQRFGQATGGPAGSYGGGAIWNQVGQDNPAPVNYPATVRPYQAGIDPNFGNEPFEPGAGAASQYRDFMRQLYDAGGLTDAQKAAYERNTGQASAQPQSSPLGGNIIRGVL